MLLRVLSDVPVWVITHPAFLLDFMAWYPGWPRRNGIVIVIAPHYLWGLPCSIGRPVDTHDFWVWRLPPPYIKYPSLLSYRPSAGSIYRSCFRSLTPIGRHSQVTRPELIEVRGRGGNGGVDFFGRAKKVPHLIRKKRQWVQ